MRLKHYHATTTGDEGGAITNIDECDKDNDFEFMNLLNELSRQEKLAPAKKELIIILE